MSANCHASWDMPVHCLTKHQDQKHNPDINRYDDVHSPASWYPDAILMDTDVRNTYSHHGDGDFICIRNLQRSALSGEKA